METEKRKPRAGLEKRLFEEFYRFSFFEAVRLLEEDSPDKKPLGTTLNPAEEPVRFSVKPGFSFPPSDIAHLEQPSGKGRARMDVAFLGLIGPSGVLPYWYNELAVERVRLKDHTLVDFLDLFHHRLLSLFYLAWKRTSLPANYRQGALDRLSWYLFCLIGLGTDNLRGKIGLAEESLLYCAGLLNRRVPSAAALEAAVAYMADTHVEVHQFIERMIPLDPGDCTQLGAANAVLGESIVSGFFARECQSKFRIHLGPMGYRRFLSLLPSGDVLRPLFSFVRYMVGIEYEFEIRVFLKAREVPMCKIGDRSPESPRLGWSTWVASPGAPFQRDACVAFQETHVKEQLIRRTAWPERT